MKKRIKFLMLMFLIGWGFLLQNLVALADTMEYTVVANLPENQINKNISYFDLKMEPGSTQEISLTVKNTSKETLDLMVEPNRAITNQNGVIEYNQSNHEKDDTLLYDFSEIMSERQVVTLEAGESKDVRFTIQMPEEEFDGIILGGFRIYEVELEESEKSTEQIRNKYEYILGVQLRETEKEVQPNVVLNEIESALINYRTATTANLQNTEAIIINQLEINAKITKEGKDEILYETTQTDLSMAPNSNFDFPISWDNQPLEAGDYHIYITATVGDQTWEFDKTFQIGEEVTELNEDAIELEKSFPIIYLVIGGGVVLGVSVAIILLRRKGDAENDQE